MAFAGGGIPEANPAVRTPTCECVSIGTETHSRDIGDVSGEGRLEGAGVDIPEANRAITTRTGERLPIRTETHADNTPGMSAESLAAFTGVDIPEANRAITTRTSESVPLGAEARTMSGDSILEGASGDMPKVNLFIIPTFTSKRLAVGAETQPIDFMDVSGKSLLKCASRHIPEAYRFVVIGTCECLAIGTETHACDRSGVSREGIFEFSSVDIPEAYRSVVIIGTSECVSCRD